MVGLLSLLLRSQLDPHIENYPLHFVVFGLVGAVTFGLGYAAGEAANRRGDARVLLLSCGGEVEKFFGDGIMARFNIRGDQPDHAKRAACAALALQREVAALVAQHDD
jgi:class 3 adenylate cyclase